MIATTDARRVALEVVGNGLLVFTAVSGAVATVATFAGLELSGLGSWPDTIVLLLALFVLGWAYDTGPLRRIHLSPAVTGAALLGGRISGSVAIAHWLAQAAGVILAGVGLWFALPWLLPDPPATSALQPDQQPLTFTSTDTIIAAVLAVVLLAVPFITAAVLASLRTPDLAALMAQSAAAGTPDAPAAAARASEVEADVATEAASEDATAAAEKSSVEPITAEVVLAELEELFVPVAEPAPAEQRATTSASAAAVPPAVSAASPARALFSAAEREEHLKEFLGIPTRLEAIRLLTEAAQAAVARDQDQDQGQGQGQGQALRRESAAGSAPQSDREHTTPASTVGPRVSATTVASRPMPSAPAPTHGNLAVVRTLPAPYAGEEPGKKGKRKKDKKSAKSDKASKHGLETSTVTVNITVGDAHAEDDGVTIGGKRKAGTKDRKKDQRATQDRKKNKKRN